MQMIEMGWGHMHVVDTGPRDGPVLVLANSLGTDLRIWDAMVAHLPRDLRILRYDKRGHGLSDCPAGPYDIGGLAADASGMLDTLGVARATFVGLSIGGLIGQGLALARPGMSRGLLLMDTATRVGTPDTWNARIAAVRADGLDTMADSVMDRWFAPERRRDAARVAPWRNMLSRTSAEGYIGCCAAIAGADFTDRVADVSCPVLAVVGAEDQATPPDVVRATADLYGAPCHVIDGAGHLPCIDAPRQTAEILTHFLEETRDA